MTARCRASRSAGARVAVAIAGAITASSFVAGQAGGLRSEEFAPRSSAPEGAPLFSTLDPEHTGVRAPNRFDDPRMWGEEFEEFAYGAIGTGVAAGDVDGDGRVDLFVVGKTEGGRLFRNLGDWRFEDVTDRAGLAGEAGPWRQGAAFADIDNDGDLDLYICRFGAPNLLYVNRGDGTFVEEAERRGLAVSDASGMAVFADYDRDGWLDLYLVTNLHDHDARPDGEPDRLYRNRGDGVFEETTGRAGLFGAAQTHAAVWWDYDEDGWPDLYATNDFGWPDQLLRNNGNGTFTNTIDLVVPHMPRFAMGADTADVNNDGHVDLLVADMLPTTRQRDQRSMIDARAHQVDPTDPRMTPQYMRNALYLNTGTGRMLEAAYLAGLAATDWTWSVRFEDFDNDGWIDLHVTNGMIREFFDVDLRAQLEGLPPTERRRRIRKGARLDERNLAFRNRGDLHFEEVGGAWGLDHLGISFGAATADFDGDGDLDLVFGNYQENVTLCRNDSDAGNRLIIRLQGRASNRFGIGVEVCIETDAGVQVRQLSPMRGYLSSSEPILHFGLGAARVIRRLVVRWPSGHEQTFNNLTANRRYTVEEPATPPPAPRPPGPREARGQFVEVGEYTKLGVSREAPRANELAGQPLLPFRQAALGPPVAIGDLDGDGREDVVIGGSGPSPTQVFRAGEKAQFTLVTTGSAFKGGEGVLDAGVVVFEANGDGRPDVLIARGGVGAPAGDSAYQVQLYLNLGDGRLAPADTDALPRLPISAGAVSVADVNRDGRLDLLIGGRVTPGAYPSEPSSALLINEGGRFRDATAEFAPELGSAGLVSSALWTDVDHDGWPDLLLALHWGPVRAWRNDGGRRLVEMTTEWGFGAAGSGFWNSLAAADFNADGLLDYAVGNLGLNTRYRASSGEPMVLYRGDFDGSGRVRLIEAEYDQGRLVPVRGLTVLSRVFPTLRRRFPTAAAFADADVTDVFGQDRLAAARQYRVTELRSGVFLSQAGGRFRFHPLPRGAQLAPIDGLLAGDVDGDGIADLYGVQNSYAPVPEVGRFDGGLSVLLRGKGNGGFSVVPHVTSNLLVPGDAEALARFDPDGDGWPDFLITRNDGRAMVYANTGVEGRHSLRVHLRGPAGNPTGIGTRVRAIAEDGTVQVSEVTAGSGYLSQSSPACFFGSVEENPLRRLEIRWPDGRLSEVSLPAALPQQIGIRAP